MNHSSLLISSKPMAGSTGMFPVQYARATISNLSGNRRTRRKGNGTTRGLTARGGEKADGICIAGCCRSGAQPPSVTDYLA